MTKKRTVGELKKWLEQFPDNWDTWAYEGEVQGVIVANPEVETEDYCFHNELGKWGIGDEVIGNNKDDVKKHDPNPH
jgi:CYTH domain-containing protein